MSHGQNTDQSEWYPEGISSLQIEMDRWTKRRII